MANSTVITVKAVTFWNATSQFTAGQLETTAIKASLGTLTAQQRAFAQNFKYYRVAKMSVKLVPMQNMNGYTASSFYDLGQHGIIACPDFQVEPGNVNQTAISSWADFINKPGCNYATSNRPLYKSMVPYTMIARQSDPSSTTQAVSSAFLPKRKQWSTTFNNNGSISADNYGQFVIGYCHPINNSTAAETTNYSCWIYTNFTFEFKSRIWSSVPALEMGAEVSNLGGGAGNLPGDDPDV